MWRKTSAADARRWAVIHTHMKHQVDYIAFSLIENFQCGVNDIQIAPNLSIVRLSALDDPRATLIFGNEGLSVSRSMVTEDTSPNSVCLVPFGLDPTNTIYRPAELTDHTLQWHFVSEIDEPLGNNFEHHTERTRFDNVLTALRILKPEFVGRYPTYNIGDPLATTVPGGIVISSPTENINYLGANLVTSSSRPYVLESSEVESLRLVFDAIHDISNPNLRVALSRLNRQYTRETEDDRIIDAVVALESIYLANANDELKFRLGIRVVAHLGGDDVAERERLFELVSASYDLRSRIVHGALHRVQDARVFKRGVWARPDDLLRDLTTLLRRSLKSILLEIGAQKFKSQFHKDLDKAIIKGRESI